MPRILSYAAPVGAILPRTPSVPAWSARGAHLEGTPKVFGRSAQGCRACEATCTQWLREAWPEVRLTNRSTRVSVGAGCCVGASAQSGLHRGPGAQLAPGGSRRPAHG